MHPYITFYSAQPITDGVTAFQSFWVKKLKMAAVAILNARKSLSFGFLAISSKNVSGHFGNPIFTKNNRVPPPGEYNVPIQF
jgi:hypothetical protein